MKLIKESDRTEQGLTPQRRMLIRHLEVFLSQIAENVALHLELTLIIQSVPPCLNSPVFSDILSTNLISKCWGMEKFIYEMPASSYLHAHALCTLSKVYT